MFFCFKQKTANEMRISDWSSDVCSSDLSRQELQAKLLREAEEARMTALEDARRREEAERQKANEEERRRAEEKRLAEEEAARKESGVEPAPVPEPTAPAEPEAVAAPADRKSTRLNSSH